MWILNNHLLPFFVTLFTYFALLLGKGKSDESQSVLNKTSICYVCVIDCGKAEVCSFNFKATLRYLNAHKNPICALFVTIKNYNCQTI